MTFCAEGSSRICSWRYRGTSLTETATPYDPAVRPCLGSCLGAFSYERGTPVQGTSCPLLGTPRDNRLCQIDPSLNVNFPLKLSTYFGIPTKNIFGSVKKKRSNADRIWSYPTVAWRSSSRPPPLPCEDALCQCCRANPAPRALDCSLPPRRGRPRSCSWTHLECTRNISWIHVECT